MNIVPLSVVICPCIVIYEVPRENLNMSVKDQIVSGYCAVSWEKIRHLFCQNFRENLDIGATLCIYYQGQCVVDLAGGWFDIENRTRPYTHDTLQIVYSTGKGVMATALALCVQRGLLDYEEYVATYWPEFGKNGKENVKVKDLLSHRAGLVVIDDNDGILKVEDTFDDPTKIVDLLAKQKPYWTLDTGGHGYHALTFGYLAGELLRRVDIGKHRSMGQFIQEEITQVVGNCEYIVSNCLSEEHLTRVSPCIPPAIENQQELRYTLHMRTFTLNGLVPCPPIDGTDKRLSPVNGFTNARSLARIYASLLFTENLLTSETLSKSIVNNTPHDESDLIFNNLKTKFSQGGYMLDEMLVKDFGKVFGHWGLGGSIAFACLDKQLSFAYVPNKTNYDMSRTDFRVQRILDGIRTLID